MKKNTGNLGSCSSKNLGGVLKFVIPSLLGVFLFMTPISIGGEITIPVAVIEVGSIDVCRCITDGFIIISYDYSGWNISDQDFFTEVYY